MSSQSRPKILSLLAPFLVGVCCAFVVSGMWSRLATFAVQTDGGHQLASQDVANAPRQHNEGDEEWGEDDDDRDDDEYDGLTEEEYFDRLDRELSALLKTTMQEIDHFWKLAGMMEVNDETRVVIRFENNPNLRSHERREWHDDMPQDTDIEMIGDGGVLNCLGPLGAIRYALSSDGDGGAGFMVTWYGSVTVSNSEGRLFIGIDPFGFIAGSEHHSFQRYFFSPRLAALIAEEYARVHGRKLPASLIEAWSGETWLKRELHRSLLPTGGLSAPSQ